MAPGARSSGRRSRALIELPHVDLRRLAEAAGEGAARRRVLDDRGAELVRAGAVLVAEVIAVRARRERVDAQHLDRRAARARLIEPLDQRAVEREVGRVRLDADALGRDGDVLEAEHRAAAEV